jgi:S1-C subfamily serine protease
MTHLQNLSNDLAEIVASLSPSIVRIEGRRRFGATGIVWQSGVIVTASHVIRRDGEVKIGLEDGQTAVASLVGRDEQHDIAVLRTDADLTPIKLADSELRVGNIVLALGRPMMNVQATFGIVSAIGGRRRHEGMIHTDVRMYPGFSGGPLADASGAVHGLNTSGFRSGVSIAIRSSVMNDTVTMLLQHGKMKQGWLGVGSQPVRLPDSVVEAIGQETGLILVSVDAGSPAEQAGLLIGDVLVSIDDDAITHIDSLISALRGNRIGQSVPAKVLRGGVLTDLTLTIGEKS